MARINITAQTLAGSYPELPVGAGSADLVWTPASVALKNDTSLVVAKTVLLARNVAASASHNVTISSVPDSAGRTGDIGPYVLAAGKVARFGAFISPGWGAPTTGRLQFEADSAEVEFAVLTLP
jgi:hypothetical protein